MIKSNGTKWSMIWSNKICNFPVRIVQCIWNVSWSSRGVLMHRWGIAAGDWRKLVVCLLNSPKVILERDVYHYAIEHGEKDPQNMQGEIKLTFMILTLYEVGFNTLDFSTAISVEGICFNLSRLSISFFFSCSLFFHQLMLGGKARNTRAHLKGAGMINAWQDVGESHVTFWVSQGLRNLADRS